jgi:hypothetical protein
MMPAVRRRLLNLLTGLSLLQCAAVGGRPSRLAAV